MIGKRLGNWVIEKELGRGGMGRVFLAREEPTGSTEGRVAAVKVLAAELAQETGFLDRFQREIDILRQLSHPNIVRLYEAGIQEGLYYYAMEYLPGQNFEDWLHNLGRVPWKEVLDIALQLCPALKHAHDHGIIHRDIKPPNLLRGDNGVVKLTDFGIAKVFAGKHLTVTGALVGTADYLSPEQAAGKPVTHRSDLYSLGVVLYTLLTGRTPFTGHSALELMHKHRYAQFELPHRYVADLPHELEEIVCGLLEKDPSRRPANALMLQRQLESFRNKLVRRGQQTMTSGQGEHTRADSALVEETAEPAIGPATMAGALVRETLMRDQQGGPLRQFLNRPAVLASLFALCVGVMVWGVWLRPREPEPETPQGQKGEAQRFYDQADGLFERGKTEQAGRIWQKLVRAFRDVESERPWVREAERRLRNMPDLQAEDDRPAAVQQVLEHARELKRLDQRDKAEELWQALEELYWNDPRAPAILSEIRRDRGEIRRDGGK
jgi:serine/threonine-protein kinase